MEHVIDAGPSAVVGIGASAGGLEALRAMLANLPETSNFAFVIVQHLSKRHKSMMREILSKDCKLPIITVEENTPLRPNHIYLNSPHFELELLENNLVVSPVGEDDAFNYPIDRFFSSLASSFLERSIAIILSGTGTDGLNGARNIRSHGGIVLVQELQSAKFDGMPANVFNSEVSAQALMPDEMGEHLSRIAEELRDRTIPIVVSQQQWTRLYDTIRSVTGHDFTLYKKGTVLRRLEKRVAASNCKNFDEYLKIVANDINEPFNLYNDLLIGVTEFFRNAESFEQLNTLVLPEIVAESSDNADEIRVWSMGCSIGMEPYSLAIMFSEYLRKHNVKRSIRIFATDISEVALKVASRGEYTPNQVQGLEPELLQRYFTQEDFGYRVKPSLRRLITFAQHNVALNPPYSNLDLVLCRNVLIYFLPELQNRVISIFNYCLRHGGFLFLGTSESLGLSEQYFQTVSLKHRIFKKVGKSTQKTNSMYSDFELRVGRQAPGLPGNYHSLETPIKPRKDQFSFYRMFVEKSLGDGLVVDDQRRLVHVAGAVRRLVNYAAGPASLMINRVFDTDFAEILAAGITRCLVNNCRVVSQGVSVRADYGKTVQQFDISFEPLVESDKDPTFVAIRLTALSDVQKADIEQKVLVAAQAELLDDRIENLERELLESKNLQIQVSEQLESANQELQATNEELISSNEELQSTNEELQSLNEELHTVNAEYQAKIDELLKSNQISDALFRNKEVGILLLDSQRTIIKFSQGIQPLVTLMPHDIGRSINQMRFKFEDKKIKHLVDLAMNSKESSRAKLKQGKNNYSAIVSPVAQDGVLGFAVLTICAL